MRELHIGHFSGVKTFMPVIEQDNGTFRIVLENEVGVYQYCNVKVVDLDMWRPAPRDKRKTQKKPTPMRDASTYKVMRCERCDYPPRPEREAIKEADVKKSKKRKRKNSRPDKDTLSFVLKRDNHQCVECGGTALLEVHHMVHRKHGGTHDPDNLITLCAWCHAEKHKDEPIYRLMRSRLDKLGV